LCHHSEAVAFSVGAVSGGEAALLVHTPATGEATALLVLDDGVEVGGDGELVGFEVEGDGVAEVGVGVMVANPGVCSFHEEAVATGRAFVEIAEL
jgi:hypothetical protein